jgi:hypothetical protein
MSPDESYRILVTGWRAWPREAAYVIHQTLFDAVRADPLFGRQVVVVDGACPHGGIDEYAHEWAAAHPGHCTSERHPANWRQLGKAAGMIRNQFMVDLGADICLGFPGPSSRGTIHCMDRARAAEIPVIQVTWDPSFLGAMA